MSWALAGSTILGPEEPRPRVVVRFDLIDGTRTTRYWLVAARTGNEFCIHPPGFSEGAVVVTDTSWLIPWQRGAGSLPQAQRGRNNGHWPALGHPDADPVGRLSPFAGVRPVVPSSA